MKIKFLRCLATVLEKYCFLLHWIPFWGCKLANWSAKLDEKHKLGVWEEVKPPDS